MADQVIIEFIGDTSKLEEAYDKVSEHITNSANLNKESLSSFQKANADAATAVGHLSRGVNQLNESLRNLSSIIAGGILKNLTADLNAATKSQNDAASATKNLANELVALKAFAQLGKGIASGFEMASNAATLFGTKNEELEKVIERLQAAMGVLNSIMEINEAVTKESAAVKLAEKGQELALAAAIELETAMQSENIIVKTAATAATKLLNLAMDANPAMILVGAIAALGGAMLYFSVNTDKAAKSVEELLKVSGEHFNLVQMRGEATVVPSVPPRITWNLI